MEDCSFQRLGIKQFPQVNDRITAENRYWSKLRSPQIVQHVAPVSHLECCPITQRIAATSSTRIHLYNANTQTEVKALSRFKTTCYSGSFRQDGQLVVAGDQQGLVQVFDVNSRSILRSFQGHQASTRVTRFDRDNVHVLSGSDDKTVRLWDLPAQKVVQTWHHTDYVRCAVQGLDRWATGSYDHQIQLVDPRSGHASLRLVHGAPIESLVFLPGQKLLVSAGGTDIKIWDVLAGQLVHVLQNHQKTVTQVALDGTATRLISAALDGHVKVYDLQDYAVTHGFKYNHGITSFALSKDNGHMVVGTTDRNLEFRQKPVRTELPVAQKPKFFTRGMQAKAGVGDVVVEVAKMEKLAVYDKALRRFEYRQALDAALETRSPVIVASMLEELKRRDGLGRALGGRDEVALEPLLSYLIKYVTNPRYAALLLEICHQVCDLYCPVLGQSMLIDDLFVKLLRKLREEAQVQRDLLGVVGIMDTLLTP